MNRPVSSSLHIAAGGNGLRAREGMLEMGFSPDLPKHLLPTGGPDGETLLGRIVQQALEAPTTEPITLYANSTNREIFEAHPQVGPYVHTVVEHFDNSLGPFYNNTLSKKERTLGCAGDFYADFTWDELLDEHESASFPVTFMVGHSVEIERGAVFEVEDDGKITGLRREGRSDASALINVGVYVFDPQRDVMNIIASLIRQATSRNERLAEDVVVNALIEAGLAGAYVLPKMPFNVNTGQTYQALLKHVAQYADT